MPGISLIMWPLQVPTYFNAGHHLALYQVAGHLRRAHDAQEVHVLDGAVEQLTWKDFVVRLVRHDYEFVAIQSDLEGLEGTERTISYIREFRPRAKIVSFGRMTSMVPCTLRGFDFDAIVESGDFETGVAAARAALIAGTQSAPGVTFRIGDHAWQDPVTPGTRLHPNDWYLPLPHELPYSRYDMLYADDDRRFSGLPRQRELVVPIARGCPIGCDYCEVPSVFGTREARIGVQSVLDYVETCLRQAPFDYISFYAPTFTLNRRWVIDLCDRITTQLGPIKWKCCTTLHHLDEELVQTMGEAGCIRISVGLETLEESSLSALPPAKKRGARQLENAARWCKSSGIELNCFVIIGLPHTTPYGTAQSIQTVHELGARIRPTMYTNWEGMLPGLSESQLVRFNRQILPASHEMDACQRAEAYRLLTCPEDH